MVVVLLLALTRSASAAVVSTGIFLADLDPDTYIRIAPRSGLALRNGIDVGAGAGNENAEQFRKEIPKMSILGFSTACLEDELIFCTKKIIQTQPSRSISEPTVLFRVCDICTLYYFVHHRMIGKVDKKITACFKAKR